MACSAVDKPAPFVAVAVRRGRTRTVRDKHSSGAEVVAEPSLRCPVRKDSAGLLAVDPPDLTFTLPESLVVCASTLLTLGRSQPLLRNIMASFAEFYSANLSEEVKKGMRQQVLQGGWPHRPPRGYVLVGAGPKRTLEIHPKDGPLLRRAFELYATGWYSVRRLVTTLARDGLVNKNGSVVSQAHLRRLLSNPFYTGVVHWDDLQAKGRHPALVSDSLFEKVQQVTKQRYKNPGHSGSVIPGFALRGLAICSVCRGRMTGERHGKWLYYRCSRQTFRRELCNARFCNAARAHEQITQICQRVRLDPALVAELED